MRMKWFKASFTVEGAFIIPMYIILFATGMKMSLDLYKEVKLEKEHEILSDMWLVDDFYKLQIIEEARALKESENTND